MIQTFFNPEIIVASWPIVRAGLLNTVLLSLLVVPLGLIGGLILALLASVKSPRGALAVDGVGRFLPGVSPAGPAHLAVRRVLPFAGLELGGFVLRGHRLLPEHRRLLTARFSGGNRFGAGGPDRGGALDGSLRACRP
jgi:hypothetical protein